MTGSAKSAGSGTKSVQLYLHDIPVTYDSIGALGTWFKDSSGQYHCVFSFGQSVYRCVQTKPQRGPNCDRCSFEGTVYKCGGTCFDKDNGGIKL